jgi:repressor LexA
VLDFIREEVAEHGTSPTYREIASKFSFRSPKAALDHVEALVRKGYLRVQRRRSRGIELLIGTENRGKCGVNVPFLGRISAGRATDTVEDRTGRIQIDSTLLKNSHGGPLFALHVRGESMIGRGIFEGDIVVAEANTLAQAGDVVVALIDQESTLKTLAQGSDGYFLKSENPRYPDLAPVTQMDIQGVVRSLIRKEI